MKNYLFTGVSGSGRIELLKELKESIEEKGKSIGIFDIGQLIMSSIEDLRLNIPKENILETERSLLLSLRKTAMQDARIQIDKEDADLNFIGCHATFRWKGSLIDGINYHNLKYLELDGICNVVDDVDTIMKVNAKNPIWQYATVPKAEETNIWMSEEEFVSDLLADMLGIPMYIIGRNHTIGNLSDFFLTEKLKMYLAYPITAIKKDNPQLLEEIEEKYGPKLEEQFVVFNPLVIKDIEKKGKIEDLTEEVISGFNTRTVDRDYRFIDQSDFVLAIYLTEKVSPGVICEIKHAKNHGTPVYLIYPYKISPFLSEYTTVIFQTLDEFFDFVHTPDFQRRTTHNNL